MVIEFIHFITFSPHSNSNDSQIMRLLPLNATDSLVIGNISVLTNKTSSVMTDAGLPMLIWKVHVDGTPAVCSTHSSPQIEPTPENLWEV